MTIRTMRADDLDSCMVLVEREGWLSETRDVFEDSLAFDADGCQVAVEDNRVIGMIVAIAYDRAGFLGELIVDRVCRGRGYGRRLMECGIGYLKQRGCESVYLDGDTPAVPLYERLGFRTVCKSLRFVGPVTGPSADRVGPMSRDDLASVCRTDREVFGADRSFFLRRRHTQNPHLCLMEADRPGPRGYIMGRPGRGVLSVGPWLAARSSSGAALLGDLARKAGNLPLRIAVLESNLAAVDLVRSLGTLEEHEPSWRMVLGPDIGLGVTDYIFAVGAPAKG